MIRGTDLELELETLVDRHGLTEVLNSLQGICGLKADHVRENWQDEGMAKVWEHTATAIEIAWDTARNNSEVVG